MTVLTERADVWSCGARHPSRTFWTELCQVPTHAFAGLYSFCLVSGTCITMVMTNNVRARVTQYTGWHVAYVFLAIHMDLVAVNEIIKAIFPGYKSTR